MWILPTRFLRRFRRRKFWASKKSAALLATATAFLIVACTNAGASDPVNRSDAGNTQPTTGQASAATATDLQPAIDFDLTLFQNGEHQAGEQISLSDFAGEPVVLNFWFPSCPPCVAEMPDFEKLHQKFKGDGLKVIGIQLLGLDTAEDGQAFINQLGINYMIGPDQTADSTGKTIMNYKISGFPTTVFINRDQNIVKKWSGALNLEKLEELTANIMN